MAYALELLAFFGLVSAQAIGALFACFYPWHHCIESGQGSRIDVANQLQLASAQ
jgi:hypothetical protein